MYYGVGQIVLALALADGSNDKEELLAMEQRIKRIGEEANIDLGLVASTFKQHVKSNSFTSRELLEEGIKNFHLGDSHLTPMLADLFLQVLVDVAYAKGSVDDNEKDILEGFVQYLTDRKRQAENREKGYTKSIMVPIDFDAVSNVVVSKLREAENWLKSGFDVTLLHCISPDDCKDQSFDDKKAIAEREINELVTQYQLDQVFKGRLHVDIINERLEYLNQNYLNDKDFDLVIMGTHGKEEEDYKKGTHTAEHIQRHFANYVVIPEHTPLKPIHTIAICADFNHGSFKQFSMVKELCLVNDAKVTLVHVDKDPLSERQREKKEELERYFNTSDVQNIPLQENVYMDMVNFADQNGYDMLVALPLHTKFFEDFGGHQSVVKKLVQFTKTPLLVLNSQTNDSDTEKLVLEML